MKILKKFSLAILMATFATPIFSADKIVLAGSDLIKPIIAESMQATAKKNGYNVVGIYDKSEEKPDELKELVDVYIHNYSELDV